VVAHRWSIRKSKSRFRLDEEAIAKFRESGKGWQRYMNDALREAVGLAS
jgi:uncharacterized protein (DUF4415 family)